jgi:hypothetical protein
MTLENKLIMGVLDHFGPRVTQMSKGGHVNLNQLVRTGIWDFNYDDLPIGAIDNLGLSIPANSTILAARFRIVEAFTSTSTTTDLEVGFVDSGNNVIDDDALLTAFNGSQTSIAVKGLIISGSGAGINKTVGATAVELSVTPSVDDLLTGRGQVIVEYLVPAAAPA